MMEEALGVRVSEELNEIDPTNIVYDLYELYEPLPFVRYDLVEAVRKGDLDRVQTLIRSGVDVNGPPWLRENEGSLLSLAIKKRYEDIALALLEAGADVHTKDEDGWTALHCACYRGFKEVVQALIDRGSRVNVRDSVGRTPLMVADTVGHNAISFCLLQAGGLPMEKVDEFCRACHERDLLVVTMLLKNGCQVSLLSDEEQEELLHHACHERDMFVVHILLENGAWNVSILSREQQEDLLHCACHAGDVFVVEALLDSGCDMNCANSFGYTPLMDATEKGHEEIVKKLILAGANVGMQTAGGNTALHIAAFCNKIQCGILLAEGGASVKTKNNLAQMPLDLGSTAEFKEAIKQALSFTTRKTLCIIGNAEGGKSTLIAALQAESNSFLGKMVNRLRRVNDQRQRTAGIEIVPHCSHKYGEVLFFDFAGQDDYHGPHQMFMESLLSKPGVSMTLLLVVKMTEEEEDIVHQLHRWLSPVALMATHASPPQVILIGSFLDKVKSKGEAIAKLTRCVEATKRDLKQLPLEFMGSSFLNCRQPQSQGIDHICKFLQEIPIPEFRATHTRYSLAWVLSQIRSSIKTQAVQLQEFSAWVEDNKHNLPRPMPTPEEVCQDLSAAGHALYLPNKEDPPKSWLVLDLPSILHDVYGTLFSQYKEIVNEFGLLHCHCLAKFFPHLDLEMVEQLLISLEFCLPVDPSLLKVDLSELTQSKETSRWLFFPALISANHSQFMLEGPSQQTVHYLCWQLRTSKKHSISARLLQTILLRLAAHFVLKQCDEEGIQQHCCCIWWNGISWQSKKGIDTTVHIINNRVIQVIGASCTSADKSCQYQTDVISDILASVLRLSPKLAAGAYIVHPPKMATSPEDITAPPRKELFPVKGILSSIRNFENDSLSLKDGNTDRCTRVAVSTLFGGCTPSLDDVRRICWPQSEPHRTQSPTGLNMCEANQVEPLSGPSHPEQSQPDVLSQTVYSCEGYLILFRKYVSRTSPGKGRAVLEGVGLPPETIEACYSSYPRNEEEAVQAGLNKWAEGHHGYRPTWRVLIVAMLYAGIAQHHCQGLREELYQKLIDVPATPSQAQLPAEQSETEFYKGAVSGSLTLPSAAQALYITSQSLTLPSQPVLHSEGHSVSTDYQTVSSSARAFLDVLSTPDMRDVDELS